MTSPEQPETSGQVTWAVAAASATEALLEQEARRTALAEREAADDEVMPHLEAMTSADLEVARVATGRLVNRDVSVDLEDEEEDSPRQPARTGGRRLDGFGRELLRRARADERARVLADVDATLRDYKRLRAWQAEHPAHEGHQMCPTCAADYLADVLGGTHEGNDQ